MAFEGNYVDIITTVGFPIFLVIYFLFRFENTLRKNTKALNELNLTVTKLNGRIK